MMATPIYFALAMFLLWFFFVRKPKSSLTDIPQDSYPSLGKTEDEAMTHTFEEAVQYLEQGNHIDYEVEIPEEGRKFPHHGALMTRDEWLADVENRFFIDYDGFGSMVTKDGKFIGDNIRPSSAVKLLLEHPDTAYILWYNR